MTSKQTPTAAMSIGSLKIFTAIFVFGAAGSAASALGQIERGSVTLGFVMLVSTICMTAAAIVYGGALTARLRDGREVESDAPTIESLAARLARAERQASYLPSIAIAVVAMFGLIVVFQAVDRAGSVATTGITLRDDNGDVVAQLRTTGGAPQLDLYGHDKKLRASIGLEKGGDLFAALRDASGKVRWLALAGEAGTRSTVYSAGGK